MKVSLESVNNPDFYMDNRKISKSFEDVQSLLEAVSACENFIDTNNLGGGNWSGGDVFDDENKLIAHISYNGRVWEPGDYPTKEIVLQ
jgi:hypothetical protein